MKLTLNMLVGFTVLATASSQGSLIAFWDFNDGFEVPDETPQIVHTASSGSGVLYQQRADTDGNGKGGVAFVDASLGINATDGKTMAWDDVAKSGDNDAEFFITVSTLGFTDIVVSMDIKGNAEIGGTIVSYDLKYSLAALQDVTNPGDVIGTIKDFAGGVSTELFNNQPVSTTDAGFTRVVADLSGFAALDNQGTLSLRFDDWKENDSMSIDNLLITGNVVPEPSVAMFGAVALAGLLRHRRRDGR